MQDRVANVSRENDFHLTGIRVYCTKLPKKGLLNKLYAHVKYTFYICIQVKRTSKVFFCPYSLSRTIRICAIPNCRFTKCVVVYSEMYLFFLYITTLLSSIKQYETHHRYFINFNSNRLVI